MKDKNKNRDMATDMTIFLLCCVVTVAISIIIDGLF